MRGRHEDSLQSLSLLRGLPIDDERVQMEWKGIIADVALEREVSARRHGDASGVKLELKTWGDLFTRKYWRRTAIAMAIPFFQQVSTTD